MSNKDNHNWRTELALVITLFWAASYVLSVIRNDYTSVGVITPVMVIAASYLLGSEFMKKRNGTQ